MKIDISDRALNQMLFIGVLVVGLGFLALRHFADVSQPLERRATLQGISIRDISRIEIQTPDMMKEELKENQFVASKIVTDSAMIGAILHAYQTARPFQPGDGRLSGKWRVNIDFYLKNGKLYHSNVIHNDYSDLLFIASEQKQYSSGTRDFLSTRELDTLVERALRNKQP